ncbi:hypothetical protein B0F90DRAFT_1666320 [Multifurca ochricompacta]|uniref:Homeobox domain-containing protein n=1 Tax=Multifurca ochricompacta TaxID=376703 RepID=A0AAD4QN33_9AGAM|nr:hypothetical protein B0F90DRAFT_1666320 [Multifurca ochricompacta]
MSHPNYNTHGRSLRPSPTGGDSHSGSSFSEQGRTILPPLTIAFPTSNSPVSGNYPNPYTTQQRSTPVPYEQTYYSSAQQQTQAGYANYPSYQQLSDARYPSGQTYGSYNRASPPSSSADPRRLPPLSVPREDRWQAPPYYQPSHTDLQMPPTTNDIRSPHAMYSPASNYPQYQSLASAAYPSGHSSSRGAVPAAAVANSHYHQSMSLGHASVERTMPSSRTTAQLPYARMAPPAMSPVDYEPHPDPAEPTIKKKRKRADARQLEVLNATYARTAFPSTEERAALAKELDMSARSVQIWFQNKRQSMRQGGRTTSSVANPTPNAVPPPVPTPTPPISGYRGSPALVSPMAESSAHAYSSRSPPPAMMRTGQSPPPPGGRTRPDIEPRRHWPGRGY